MQSASGLARLGPGVISRPFVPPILHRQVSPDPNAFYYKSSRPSVPRASFALECAQWRHDNEAQPLHGEIHVPVDQDEAEGLLVCRLEAANLSKSVSCRIPVRIVITRVSAFESARSMVEALVDGPEFRIAVSRARSDATE